MTEQAPGSSHIEIILIAMDKVSSMATFVRSDMKQLSFPLDPSPFRPESRIASLTYAPQASLLIFQTVRGESILAELPLPENLAPRRGRLVVYLDQKDWSSLANTLHEPAKVPPAERDASLRLIALAKEGKIILPMSAGHMSETCKWNDGAARYRLALTILQLSSGWQMRDPLDVRRFELRRSFIAAYKGFELQQEEVFTLEPYAIHGKSRGQKHPEVPIEFPEDVALATAALTAIAGNFDVMLDAEAVPMGTSPGWVDKNQNFSDWLAGEKKRTPLQRRQSIDVLFVSDASKEIAEEAFRSGITPEQMSEWMQEMFEREIRLLPNLGLFRETLLGMHLNQTRWENNHLTDLMYLTCAAGYADYVVGEKSLVGYIRAAQKRMNREVNAYRRIQDLLPVLEERLSGGVG